MPKCDHKSGHFVAGSDGTYYRECLDCRSRGPKRKSTKWADTAFWNAAAVGELDVTSWDNEHAERLLGPLDEEGTQHA
jgi:hypothetical protein